MLDINKLVVGQEAIEAFQSLQSESNDIYELGFAIRGPEPVLRRDDYERPNFYSWRRPEILDATKFILSILAPPPSPNHRFLNKTVIQRANYMGLMPSPVQVYHPRNFGSMSRLYRDSGESSSYHPFHELTRVEAMEHLADFEKCHGRMPGYRELEEIAAKDSSKPSCKSLYRVLEYGLTGAARELGYVEVRGSDGQVHKDWAVDFWVANAGIKPTQKMFQMYSPFGKAPGYTHLVRTFNSGPEFEQDVENAKNKDLLEICQRLNAGVPAGLLYNLGSGTDLIGRLIRYDATGLVPGFSETDRVRIATAKTDEYKFIEELVQVDPNITFYAIEGVAEKFGVFKNMWRPHFLQSLRLGSMINLQLSRLRGEVSNYDRLAMINAVRRGAEYLIDKDRHLIKHRGIEILMSEGYLPLSEEFYRLFVEDKFYRYMVREELARSKAAVGQVEKIGELVQALEDRAVTPKIVSDTLQSGFSEFIGTALVVRTKRAANGYIIKILAPQKPENLIPAGSLKAESIVGSYSSGQSTEKWGRKPFAGTRGVANNFSPGQKRSNQLEPNGARSDELEELLHDPASYE